MKKFKVITISCVLFAMLFSITAFAAGNSSQKWEEAAVKVSDGLGPYKGPADTKDYNPKFINPPTPPAPGEVRPMIDPDAPDYCWPTGNLKITQKFRPTDNPDHKGIDIAYVVKDQDPIFSIKRGYVVYKQFSYWGGNGIWINHIINGNYVQSRYMHMVNASSFDRYTWTSDYVQIGLKGNTADPNAYTFILPCHLHFEMRNANSYIECADAQVPFDPLTTYYPQSVWNWF